MTYTILVDKYSEPQACIATSRPLFGDLYLSDIWEQISFFPLDRKTRDHAWKLAHGVLYNVDRLNNAGRQLDTSCFCYSAPETLMHLFF